VSCSVRLPVGACIGLSDDQRGVSHFLLRGPSCR
jgi:hypothetical protein